MLRRCWSGGRKGIRPVNNRVVGCWRGYLSGSRCRLAYGPADATATHSLASVKSRLVLALWYRLTRLVPDKGPLNGGGCMCSICKITYQEQNHRYRCKMSPEKAEPRQIFLVDLNTRRSKIIAIILDRKYSVTAALRLQIEQSRLLSYLLQDPVYK